MILIISVCKYKFFELEFINPIINIIKEKNFSFQKIHLKNINENFNFSKYSKIIICGTALKDFEYEKYETNWIKNINSPILGICAGAQILGKEFGGKVKKHKEIGYVKPIKKAEDKILEKLDLNKVYCIHNKYVTLPKGFKLILENKIPLLFKKNKIYCSLFHPEVENKNLIRNFLNN